MLYLNQISHGSLSRDDNVGLIIIPLHRVEEKLPTGSQRRISKSQRLCYSSDIEQPGTLPTLRLLCDVISNFPSKAGHSIWRPLHLIKKFSSKRGNNLEFMYSTISRNQNSGELSRLCIWGFYINRFGCKLYHISSKKFHDWQSDLWRGNCHSNSLHFRWRIYMPILNDEWFEPHKGQNILKSASIK